MGINPDRHSSLRTHLAWAAPLVALAVGGLALAAERGDVVPAPLAIAVIAVAAAVLLWAIARTAAGTSSAHSRSESERRRLEARIEQIAGRDALTGVLDHRRLEEELRRQLAFAQRYGAQMAVLAIQLDGFEELIEAHGQATADELLIATAEVLTDELRSTDIVTLRVPHGFFVLLPQADKDAARIVAAKLVRRLRAIERGRPYGDLIALRASIGVAVSDPEGFDDAERLLARADAALATAQATGGDRIALSEEPVLEH